MKRSDNPGESHFVLFANTAADNDINKNQYDEGNDLIEEVYFLPLDTVFVDLLTELTGRTPLDSNTNEDENEAVIIFRPPLADAYVAANDHNLPLTEPADLYLEFKRAEAAEEVPSQYIHINRIAGFPEIERE